MTLHSDIDTAAPSIHSPFARPAAATRRVAMPDCAPAGMGLIVLAVIVSLTFFSHSPDRWFYLALADVSMGLCLGLQILVCRRSRITPTTGPKAPRLFAVGPANEHVCTPHRVEDLIEQALLNELHEIGEPQIQVLRDYAEVGDVCVDPKRTLAVLRPLVRNAVDALRARVDRPTRLLLIRVSAISFSDGPHVRIEFSDNGVGIAPQNLPRLFAEGFTTQNDQPGMGLALAHRVARQMNAMLSVASAGEGCGATVTLELPAHRPLPATE